MKIFILYMFSFISILFFSVKGIYSKDVHPVSIDLYSTGDSFGIEDAIPIKITIKPLDHQTLEFNEMFFIDFKDKIIVINPDKKNLKSKSEHMYRPTFPSRWLEISDENVFVYEIDLTRLFPRQPYTKVPHSFSEVGLYEISLSGEISVRSKGEKEPFWKNIINSNTLYIRIIEPYISSLTQSKRNYLV